LTLGFALGRYVACFFKSFSVTKGWNGLRLGCALVITRKGVNTGNKGTELIEVEELTRFDSV
jgi:hypothetical protein